MHVIRRHLSEYHLHTVPYLSKDDLHLDSSVLPWVGICTYSLFAHLVYTKKLYTLKIQRFD